MKFLRALLALLPFTFVAARAQEPAPAAAPAPARLAPAELEKLLAPIALYPDALIAIILPASTAPADIVLAARQLRDKPGDTSQVEHRGWDESVKALTNYPAVLTWMDENLAWTKQVGEAFATQPAEVMQAMQRLRAQARAAGTLTDTPQQQVITEPDVIRIVPTQPDVIYVPYYDPAVVFVSRPYYGYSHPQPFFTFGIGARVGSWLAFDCDWRRNTIWIGNRHRPWVQHDWRRPVVVAPPIGSAYVRGSDVRAWRPAPTTIVRSPSFSGARVTPAVVQPTPFARTEGRPGDVARPGGFTPRPGESDRSAGSQRPRPDDARDRRPGPTAGVSMPARPQLPALAPTVPPASPAVTPPPDRSRDNRGRNPSPRSQPSTVVTAPPVSTPPATAPSQPHQFHRRPPAPAMVAPPSGPAANFPPPAPAARPDFRGHPRSAPAAVSTPPASAPAAQPQVAPANPPSRGDRSGGRRDGRSGDPER